MKFSYVIHQLVTFPHFTGQNNSVCYKLYNSDLKIVTFPSMLLFILEVKATSSWDDYQGRSSTREINHWRKSTEPRGRQRTLMKSTKTWNRQNLRNCWTRKPTLINLVRGSFTVSIVRKYRNRIYILLFRTDLHLICKSWWSSFHL